MRLIYACALFIALMMVASRPLSAADPSAWLSQNSFAASPKALLEYSATIPIDDEEGVQVFLDEAHFTLHAQGTMDARYRLVYRIDSQAFVDSWSRVSRHWQPWFQDRPEPRARVVTPGGQEHWLDPANLGEYSEGEDGPNLYTDIMSLRGPLPAVDVGVIVEEEWLIRDREPFFAAGRVRGFAFGRYSPVQATRVTVDAAAGVPVNFRTHRIPNIKRTQETTDNGSRVVFEHGPLAALEDDADYAPGDVARHPSVRFSTGETWNAIATAYARIVEESITGDDVTKWAKKAVGREKNPKRRVERLLSKLHDEIRYTGVEFGERGLIPTHTSETLARKFGDCKDKSTLLIAMLHAAGIEARLALLRTGPDNDVDPELPGMGRFDHAIVHVLPPVDLWIDATHPFASAGELPLSSRGRWALIADPATTKLVRTPSVQSQDNRRKEFREVHLARSGNGRVVETSEVLGSFNQQYRSTFDGMSETDAREQLESYVDRQYGEAELVDYELTAPEDLSQPMSIRLDIADSPRAHTTTTEATAVIEAGVLVGDFPAVLKPDNEDDPAPPQKFPVELHKPYVIEMTYKIVPPPGFASPTLPDSGERSIGPAVLEQRYTLEDDGSVTAHLKLDTKKVIYSVEEAAATKSALTSFYKEKKPVVTFQQMGETHLEAGRIREALEEFKALARQYPEESIYHTQVSRAYLEAGLGRDAREQARRAVQLAPESMIAHRNLGIVLGHDQFGRKFHAGLDHAGAVQALERAHELDPEDFIAWGELAILLEHDAEGHRYSEESYLGRAIEELTGIRTKLSTERLSTNLLINLYRAERYEEVVKLWPDLPRVPIRDAVYLAALTIQKGADAAVKEGNRIAADAAAFRTLIATASNWVDDTRRYPEAAVLLTAGAKGADNSLALLAYADQLRRTKHHQEFDLSLKTPEGFARAFLHELIGDGDIARLIHPEVLISADLEDLEDVHDFLDTEFRALGISRDAAQDRMLSLSDPKAEGKPERGFRVRVNISLTEDTSDLPFTLYVAREGEEYRLLGVTSWYGGIGQMLLNQVDQDRLPWVRHWLDWMAEELRTGEEDVANHWPMEWLWKKGGPKDTQAMRRAAMSLMVDGTYGTEPLEKLETLLEATDDPDAQTGLLLALITGAVDSEDHDRVVAASKQLLKLHPDSTNTLLTKVRALAWLGRNKEAEKELRDRKSDFVTAPDAASAYVDMAALMGDLKEYRRRLMELIDGGRATHIEFNNVAWLDAFEGRASEQSLEWAHRAVSLTGSSDPITLHTLATVYAELGRVAEARDILMALLDNRSEAELESPDWYIVGRIAEHYGAAETARMAYEKVEPPQEGRDYVATRSMADRRLSLLQTTASKTERKRK